ncbi:MAG TPA: histidine kinase dimerization/phospho-acceptor domain-containing protein, partial [Terriglobales bacterium]
MRSLFTRIFVSFWLIESIMFAVFILQFANRPLNVESHFSNRIRASVVTAVRLAVLRRRIEGNYGYLDALEDFRRDSRIQVWVTTPNGKELAGRTIPSDTLTLSHHTDLRMQVHTEEGDFVAYAEVPLNLLPPLRARDDIPRLLIGIAVSGLICYMLSLYLTRPIDNLRRAAQTIAQGDLSARAIASRNRDHIGRLVDDFNVMADRLQATISAQKQLVSDISHELRSPLARLTVALDLARSRAGNEAQGALDRMELEANRLNDMIGRILSLAQLTSGEVHMKKQQITLSELLQEVVEDADFEARARQTSVSLEVAPGSDLAIVEAYPSLLRSALENVIRNAIAYTA